MGARRVTDSLGRLDPPSEVYAAERCEVRPLGATPPPHGVVAVIHSEERLLFIQRSARVRAPGWWCFPGGAVAAGEDEPGAVRREIREELGIQVEPVRRLWRAVTAWGVDLVWWEATWLPGRGTSLQPNSEEVARVAWLVPSEALALDRLLGSNRAFLRRLEDS